MKGSIISIVILLSVICFCVIAYKNHNCQIRSIKYISYKVTYFSDSSIDINIANGLKVPTLSESSAYVNVVDSFGMKYNNIEVDREYKINDVILIPTTVVYDTCKNISLKFLNFK